jgi:4-hydroxybenzoyl-CoA reductase beta subunit
MDEALEMLHRHQGDSRILSGGTDLLVRMKQRLLQPRYLISLKSIRTHKDVRQTDGTIEIGAGASLDSVRTAVPVKKHLPGLVKAIESIGAPSIQHYAGTIGGNLCQENRCLYYNQSAFLRSARQTCHKAGGQICYALEGSDRCRSTFQSDCAPILIALNATVTAVRQGGQRKIPLADLYSAKGEAPLALEPDELVITIEVPVPEPNSGHAYQRLAYRAAIEFPMVAVGASVGTANGKINAARIVVGAISTAPLLMVKASASLIGQATNEDKAVDKAAEMAREAASAFVVNNVNAPVEYRQKMIGVLVRRALGKALKQTGQ